MSNTSSLLPDGMELGTCSEGYRDVEQVGNPSGGLEGLVVLLLFVVLPAMVLVLILITIWLVVDCIRAEQRGAYLGAWLAAIVVVPAVGPALYYFIRRPERRSGKLRDSEVLPDCSMALASLILGIVGWSFSTVGCVGLPICIGGIICGHLALCQLKARNCHGRSLAIAGLVISYLPWIAALIAAGVFVSLVAISGNS